MRHLLCLLIAATVAFGAESTVLVQPGNRYALPSNGLVALCAGTSVQGVSQGAGVSSCSDPSASGTYPFIQATGGKQPVYNALTRSGRPGLYFNGSSDFLSAASLAMNSVAFTAIIIYEHSQDQGGTSGETWFSAGNYGSNGFAFFQSEPGNQVRGNISGSNTLLSGIHMQPAGPSMQVVVGTAANYTVYREFGSQTVSGQAAVTGTGVNIGVLDAGGDFTLVGNYLLFAVYNRALSASEIAQAYAFGHDKYGVAMYGVRRHAQVVCVGDSITSGNTETLGNSYPNLIAAPSALGVYAEVTNYGQPSISLASILGNYSMVTAEYDAGYAKHVAILFAGTNDLTGCTGTADCNSKEATLQTNTTSLVTGLHAAGFQVLIITMLARSAEVVAFDVARQTYNTWLRTLSNSGADALADPGGDAYMGVLPQTSGYFSDGAHPTNLGYNWMTSQYIAPALGKMF